MAQQPQRKLFPILILIGIGALMIYFGITYHASCTTPVPCADWDIINPACQIAFNFAQLGAVTCQMLMALVNGGLVLVGLVVILISVAKY